MNAKLKLAANCVAFLLPVFTWAQVSKDTTIKHVDSTSMAVTKVDTVKVVVDTVVKKDCYAEYYEMVRMRGAKPVTDGMQKVVIALKGPNGCNCFMGQIEVVGGKMKPPLYFQAESGEYRPVSTVGRKMEPAFVASMTPDELYAIKDGMSIVFRTADQDYGRLFFYQFVNKGTSTNKMAPSPQDLMKE